MAALNIYILTFNCGRVIMQPDHFAPYLFEALPEPLQLPDILVLSLQEIAPISYSFLGGSFLTPYLNAFRRAVKLASKDTTYFNIITRNVGMTAIMIFVPQDLIPRVSWLRTAGIGVGVHGMGNKGAVGVRLGLQTDGDSNEVMELTFVAAHLAPMEDGLTQRNEDWRSIVKGMVFVSDSGKPHTRDEHDEDVPLLQGVPDKGTRTMSGMYTSQAHLFFAGDLNYRTSELKPSPEDVKSFPQPTADINDPKHFSHLLPEDQLTRQLKSNKSLHGLSEAPITFPPTYKYKNEPNAPVQGDDAKEWKWAQHRWPSWCDRILYLDVAKSPGPAFAIEVHKYKALPLFPTSDHRPVALSLSVPLTALPPTDESVEDIRIHSPFDLDPDWKAKRDLARKQEIVIGLLAYLGLTWEGNGLLVATIIGGIGGWLIISSLLTL